MKEIDAPAISREADQSCQECSVRIQNRTSRSRLNTIRNNRRGDIFDTIMRPRAARFCPGVFFVENGVGA